VEGIHPNIHRLILMMIIQFLILELIARRVEIAYQC
jgi:hypothetical protein